MEHAFAFSHLSEDISQVLLGLSRPSTQAVRAAMDAERDLEAALDAAAGLPGDMHWRAALSRLDTFLARCAESRNLDCSRARRRLEQFIEENADLLPPREELKRAS